MIISGVTCRVHMKGKGGGELDVLTEIYTDH